MDNSPIRIDPLLMLTRELEVRSRGSAGRRAMQRIWVAGIDTNGASQLSEIAGLCNAGHGGQDDSTTSMLEGILALARGDDDAAITALVALRPALLHVAARISGGRRADEDMLCELVGNAWLGVMASADTEAGGRARFVVAFTWARTWTSVRRQRVLSHLDDAFPENWDQLSSTQDVVEEATSYLNGAIRRAVITVEQAELILLSRSGAATLDDLSKARGTSKKLLTQQRARAEKALQRHLCPSPVSR